jgi:hypothetical protein
MAENHGGGHQQSEQGKRGGKLGKDGALIHVPRERGKGLTVGHDNAG